MIDRLARIDLNLLVALNALIQERNVTRAASRLCVTTSAMSKTLNRLKDVLCDPLFERGPHGLILTQRVEELAKPLADMLQSIDHLVFPAGTDLLGIEDTIHLAIPEIFAAKVVSPLLSCIAAKAPNVHLSTRNVDDDYLTTLFDGHLDYVLFQEESTPGIVSIPMGWHYPVLTMRAGHPLASRTSLDPQEFMQYPHIIYNVPKARYHEFDFYYRQLKAAKMAIWDTTQMLTAMEMLLTTDAVMIGSEISSSFRLCDGKIVTKPLAMVPGFDTVAAHMHLLFHERQTNAVLHKWFVAQLQSICATVLPKRDIALEAKPKKLAALVA